MEPEKTQDPRLAADLPLTAIISTLRTMLRMSDGAPHTYRDRIRRLLVEAEDLGWKLAGAQAECSELWRETREYWLADPS